MCVVHVSLVAEVRTQNIGPNLCGLLQGSHNLEQISLTSLGYPNTRM